MMKQRKVQIYLLVGLTILLLGVGGTFLLSLTAGPPKHLGAKNGELAPVPATPNCVSSQAPAGDHQITPMTCSEDPAVIMRELDSVIATLPGSTVVRKTERYLHAEFRSTFFRFVDDVEFLIVPEKGYLHFRAAARVGHSDLGVNRARMEHIRGLLQEKIDTGLRHQVEPLVPLDKPH